MNTDQKIIKDKVGLVNLAQMLTKSWLEQPGRNHTLKRLCKLHDSTSAIRCTVRHCYLLRDGQGKSGTLCRSAG